MTNPRFLPSAGLLLALAMCGPDFAMAVPPTLESLMSLGGWAAEDAAGQPPEPDGA